MSKIKAKKRKKNKHFFKISTKVVVLNTLTEEDSSQIHKQIISYVYAELNEKIVFSFYDDLQIIAFDINPF